MPLFNRISESFRLPGRGGRPARVCPCRTRTRQRGQALMEVTFSALLVIIPTFAIGWAMYAYGQARTSALNGARYAAWERTVWLEKNPKGVTAAVRSESEIADLMIERFFARPDAPIKSSYTASTKAKNADLPSFYSVHNGDKVIDIENTDHTKDGQAARPTLTLAEDGTTTSSIAKAYDGLAKFSKLLGAETMNLEEKGLFVATVNVKLNAIRHLKVFDELNLDITQRAAVVTDAWSAGGKKHEEAIVQPMVPVSALDPLVSALLTPLKWMGLPDPKLGCVKGDIVPMDTLPSGVLQDGTTTSWWGGTGWKWKKGWETGTDC